MALFHIKFFFKDFKVKRYKIQVQSHIIQMQKFVSMANLNY